MKTQFSWKKKIGAILLAASMLPASAAFAVEQDPELLENGNFSDNYQLTEDIAIGAAALKTGHYIPSSGWTVEARSNTNSGHLMYLNGAAKQLAFKGTGLQAYQMVKDLEPCTTYSLNYTAQAPTNCTVVAEFMHYDKESDTYLTLEEYVAQYNAKTEDTSDDISVMPAQLGNAAANVTALLTRADLGCRPGNAKLVPVARSFTMPPHANAIKLILRGNSAESQYCFFDNLSLKKGNEVVNNGGFDQHVNGYGLSWNSPVVVTETDAETGATNNVIRLADKNVTTVFQRTLLICGKTYKVSYKYKHNLTHEGANTAPFVDLAGYIDASVGYNVKAVGTEGDWTLYEGYVTIPASKRGYGVLNLAVMPRTRNEAGWAGEVFYDDISVREVSSMELNANGNAEIRYSKLAADDTSTLIVAKYDKVTKRLVDIDQTQIGAEAADARFYNYEQSLPYAYECKAFLWDELGNLIPLSNSVSRPAYVKTLPIDETFSVEGYVPTVADGWTITNPSGTISVVDGKLTLSSDAGYVDNGRVVAVNFDTVETGTIVFETDYYCTPNGCNANLGLANFKSSDGRVLTRLQLDGRGASFINSKANDNAVKNLTNWGHEQQLFRVKIEADLTNKEWRAYQGRYNADGEITYKLLETVLGNSTHAFTDAMANDVCSLEFTLSTAGQYLDNMQIYVIE